MSDIENSYSKWGKKINLIRLSAVLLIVGFAYIGFVRTWVKDSYLDRIKQQSICFNMGGNWIAWENECESPTIAAESFGETCNNTGGVYYECESPCRNVLNSSVRAYACSQECVLVCAY